MVEQREVHGREIGHHGYKHEYVVHKGRNIEPDVLREVCMARIRQLRQGAHVAGLPSEPQGSDMETDNCEVPVGVQPEGETLQPGD